MSVGECFSLPPLSILVSRMAFPSGRKLETTTWPWSISDNNHCAYMQIMGKRWKSDSRKCGEAKSFSYMEQ